MNVVALVAALSLGLAPSAGAAAVPTSAARTYGNLPMSFEPNLGQTDPEVAFLVRGRSYGLFLAAGEAVMALNKPSPPRDRGTDPVAASRPPAVVRMKFLDADPAAAIVGLEPLPGVSNYLVGNNPGSWRTRVPHYARVEYKDVYPGVDLAFRGDARALEYDFVVAPGADPGAIRLTFEGVAGLRIDPDGNLVLALEGGEDVVQKAPVSYQEINGTRTPVRASYVVDGDCEVGFAVGCHDRDRTLVIDPVLAYSTYLGGVGLGRGSDNVQGIAVDGAGNTYVTGTTSSTAFPTANPLQAANAGENDVLVAMLDAAGTALVYSTYLGGSGSESGSGIAVDGSGSAYVTGTTSSTDFPTTNPIQVAPAGDSDVFLTKLSPSGSSLVYSTYLGGAGDDFGVGIAVDGMGGAGVTGVTSSLDFPTANPLQAASAGFADAFVAKVDPAGSTLIYSTYLGGSEEDDGHGIAVDGAGNAYVTGYTRSVNFPTASPLQAMRAGPSDAFVAKLDPVGSTLVYSTYLGGQGYDTGRGIAIDTSGSAGIVGFTGSSDFPTVNPLQSTWTGGGFDTFVARLNPAGSALVSSTYLGGNNDDRGNAIAIDDGGDIYVTGGTWSTDFPTAGPLQASSTGNGDAFVARLSSTGAVLVYSTYLGGRGPDSGAGIAVDGSGSAHVGGSTGSPDFPTSSPIQGTHGGGGNDAFVLRLNPAGSALTYSTFLGSGRHDDGSADIAVDAAGNAYVTGQTFSIDFPTANPPRPTNTGWCDVFVAKFNPSGSALVYSTYLGGSGYDQAVGIAVDAAGSAYVAGYGNSTDFPTIGPIQPANAGQNDAFVAKLDPAGATLVYSTYLGGSDDEYARGMAIDDAGSAIIVGFTPSTDFPTRSPLQAASAGNNDGFVAKLNPAGSALDYSTYLGGHSIDQAFGVAADAAGNAFVTGSTYSDDFPTANPIQGAIAGWSDVFVAKLNPAGSALVYSTYLGGAGADQGDSIAVDGIGNAFVTGHSYSPDFPTANPLQPTNAGLPDVIVAKLDPAGSTLVFSTYLGGSADDLTTSIAVDVAGSVYLTGITDSSDFPTSSPFQAIRAGGSEAFVTKLDPSGSSLVHSTYLGGSGSDRGTGIAVDGGGGVYVTGETSSTDFPTLGGIRSTSAGEGDAFVTKFVECRPLPGPVGALRAVKALPDDVLFSWQAEPDSAGGYHLHAVDAKALIPRANVSNAPACTAAAGQLDCTHAAGLTGPPAELYYQVVGLCSDGFSEGPL